MSSRDNSPFINVHTYNPYEEESVKRRLDPLVIPDMAMSPFKYKFGNIPKEPAVYKVKLTKDTNGNKTFKLEKDLDRFKIREKYYGSMLADVERTWNTYGNFKKEGEKQFAFGAVGFKGMGKTEYLSLVANRAMDEGMICVLVTGIQSSPELIQFLSSLDNVFIMFDEFGKVFPPRGPQSLMLTMFNNLNQKRRIIAASDNSLNAFDEFFKDRTGRIHYLLEFYSIDEEIIREYSKDAGASKTFIEEIVKASKRVPNFSMDYIQGLIKEHRWYPEDNLDRLLYFLNLKILKHRVLIYVDKVEKLIKDENDKETLRELNFNCSRSGDMLREEFFGKHFSMYISINGLKPTREELEQKLKEAEEKDKKPNDFSMGYNNNPFMGNSPSRGRNGQADNYNDNLYLEHDDEVLNREVVGDVEYYTYALKGYIIHLRVQEKK